MEKDFSINISSDEEEIPFAERIARKINSNNSSLISKSPKRKQTYAFSDSEPEDLIPSPKRQKIVISDNISVTPPPEYVSPIISKRRMSPSPPLPDTEELVSDFEEVPLLLNKQSFTTSLKASCSSNASSKGCSNLGKVKKSKEDKDLDKQRKLEEKQRKEVDKKQSKEMKEADKLINKQTNKEEVHKYMRVVIDPQVVSSPPGTDILNMLRNPPDGKNESVFEFSVENLPEPGSLTWRRKVISNTEQGGRIEPTEQVIEEDRVLLFLSAEKLAEKVEVNCLEFWIRDVKKRFNGKHLTVMIYNYKSYLKVDKNAKERVKKATVRGDNPARKDLNIKQVSQYRMEEALLGLSIEGVADHLTFDRATDKGWRDCAGSVFHQTRAVAEAPQKLKKGLSGSAGFSFWAKADVKDCVALKNLSEYWKQVIMQVSTGSGLEKASAIASSYPSPAALLQAYSRCSCVKDCEELLSNIEVRRTENILGGTRKVGPDISRRIYIVLTSDDPNVYLSKN